MKLSYKNLVSASLIIFLFTVISTIRTQAASEVNLGTASGFAVLAGSGITNVGSTTIAGDIGTFPTTTQTGLLSVTLNGVNNIGNSVTQIAKDDLVTAYGNAAGQLPVTRIATELGGSIKNAGVYDSASGTFGITGTVTLDGQGDSSSVFIFKTNSTLITASSSKVVLINGAQECNVFWQVGSSATLGTASVFRGNILALASITDDGGSTINGRLLARNGAVTLNNTTISKPSCSKSDSNNNSGKDLSSAIRVEKDANKKTLKSGPDKVTFTYKVTNRGDVALSDISVKDDKCKDVKFVHGDNNDNEKLDTDEKWEYQCKKTILQTETNKVTARGDANGKNVKDTDKFTVKVSTPNLPNAGFENEKSNATLFDQIINNFSSIFN
jgi:hypothetical protein